MIKIKNEIKNLANKYFDEIRYIRRHLHMYPELSYQEFATSEFIKKKLSSWNICFSTPIATTGFIVILKGRNPQKKCIAIRADMDALPIIEANKVEYASKNHGVMHACGHDVHTSCLLGAIKILNELSDKWEGTVKCIFQPGEEKNPGGASLMIKEEVLKCPDVSKIIACHVHTNLDVGKFSFREGKVMASSDELYITLKSKGGHAASPHLTSDTILAASHLVVALQQIVSRNNNPFNPSVLTITSIKGGTTTNVIPDEVNLMGTFRAMNEEWRYEAHKKIEDMVKNISNAMGVDFDLKIDIGYPMVYNDEVLTKEMIKAAKEYVGAQNVLTTELRMGSEDFGYYTKKIKGVFFRLGVKKPELYAIAPVHTPNFDIDENALEYGMGMMAWLGINA